MTSSNPSRKQYMLFLSATSSVSNTTSPVVTLSLQGENYDAWSPSSCTQAQPQLNRFNLSSLLAFPAAEEAITTILPDSISNAREFNLLRRFMSSFVHRAVTEAARKSQARSLSVDMEICMSESAASTSKPTEPRTDGTVNTPKDDPETTSGLGEGEGRELPETCAVCLNDFSYCDGEKIMSTPCGHVFHLTCLYQCTPYRCPICRFSS